MKRAIEHNRPWGCFRQILACAPGDQSRSFPKTAWRTGTGYRHQWRVIFGGAMPPRTHGRPGFLRDSLLPPLTTWAGGTAHTLPVWPRQQRGEPTRARQFCHTRHQGAPDRCQSAARGLWRALTSRPLCRAWRNAATPARPEIHRTDSAQIPVTAQLPHTAWFRHTSAQDFLPVIADNCKIVLAIIGASW